MFIEKKWKEKTMVRLNLDLSDETSVFSYSKKILSTRIANYNTSSKSKLEII